MSKLLDEKRNIVRRLGFGSILDFNCYSSVNEIFVWLVNQFDSNSPTVVLDDGFSFTLCPSIVFQVLGFPQGPKPVETKLTNEACAFIHNIVHMESPNAEYLCSLLNDELDEESFKCIFMLTLLTTFIAPNASGVANSSYYPNIIDVLLIPERDWCSFTLNILLQHIKKYKLRRLQNINTDIGGCKFILVVNYSTIASFFMHIWIQNI